MRLRDLDAELKGTVADGVLMFDCPHPACSRGHKVRVPISAAPFHERDAREGEGLWRGTPPTGTPKVKVWQATGEFPDSLTLAPSVDIVEADAQGNKIRTICWHGHVTNGEVT